MNSSVVRCLLFVVHYFWGNITRLFHYIIEISSSLFSLFSLFKEEKNKIKTNSKQQNKQLSTTTTIITTTCRPPFCFATTPHIYTVTHP